MKEQEGAEQKEGKQEEEEQGCRAEESHHSVTTLGVMGFRGIP